LQATQPSITMLMPDFAERFHVMHYAGDAGDWAVAAHELLEMQRLVSVIERIDPEKGPLIKGFMTQSFAKLNAAIEHGNRQAFDKALSETVTNCNACHKAVGSAFIKVTLDVNEHLSMRHPHRLTKSKKPGAHTHTH
jgi:cytochrome c553